MAINRRLIVWLVKAYIQKWGKAIFAFFILGLVIFFLLQTVVFSFITKITSENKQVIGVVGAYTVDSLPRSLLGQASQGLTIVGPNGIVQPALATSWQVKDNGKTYIFTLRPNQHFSDGTLFTSKEVTLSFANVTISRPNATTIVYHLKDVYSPFLISVSQPIFKDGFVGLGDYKVQHVSLNGTFVQSMTLVNRANSGIVKIYQFYPTEDALKLAFSLGEISQAQGLSDISFQKTSFTAFPNTIITKQTNYQTLVTLFYNTADKNLSDNKIRDALSYTIPSSFSAGVRAYTPLSPLSWAYSSTNPHIQDLTHAKLLIEASFGSSPKDYPVLTINTLPKYQSLAVQLQKIWKTLGIQSKVVTVASVPSSFEIYLGDFRVPEDPDQYTLWHAYQDNNITNFNKDVRIDKLLEDGRKTLAPAQRLSIYADFQKYLNDQQPATFLYFPYSYTLTRK